MAMTPVWMAEQCISAVEINNVMTQHCLYNARRQQLEELDRIWTKNALEPSFSQNDGRFVGVDVLKRTYGAFETQRKAEYDSKIGSLEPEFAGQPDDVRYGTDCLSEQTLSSPLIEIAGDGLTAKGLWHVFAEITVLDDKGPVGLWGFGKMGADLVREDGQWKIWHLSVFTEFMTPAGRTLDMERAWKLCPFGLGIGVEPEKKERLYAAYSNERTPAGLIRIPQPYQTFSETFRY